MTRRENVTVGVIVVFALFASYIFAWREKVATCTTNYTGYGEESVTVCNGQTERWVKVPTEMAKCPGAGNFEAVPTLCQNGTVKVEDIGDFLLKTTCGGKTEYWRNNAVATTAAIDNGDRDVSVDPASDAPKFVKEMDKREWGEEPWKDLAWTRRLGWGTATVAGKKALWYAWSNSDAGVTTMFNVVIPSESMAACRIPIGERQDETAIYCSYSRPSLGTRAFSPEGMEWTSVFVSIKDARGAWWLGAETNALDWDGDGKAAVAALVAQIQRDFPAIKGMKVRQILK